MAPAQDKPRGDPADAGWRASAARRFVLALAVAMIGLVGIVVTSGTATIAAGAVLTAGVMLAISFVFLEIGYSEDRERAREGSRDARTTRGAKRHTQRLTAARRRPGHE